MRNNLKQAAFTLAEILIVLSIIGIIADMTIPTLVANVQKETTVTMLKKSYSELSQAMKLAEADNGMMDSWDLGTLDLASTQAFADTYIYPYIKTIKKCSQGEDGCWTPSITLNNAVANGVSPSNANALSMVTASGYSILFYVDSSNLAYFYVDINGPTKGRSKIGKDAFLLNLETKGTPSSRQGLYPYQSNAIPSVPREALKGANLQSCSNGKIGRDFFTGRSCAALIMTDGWQIAGDYPWN